MPNQGDQVKLWDMPENTGNAELSASELSDIMPGTIQFNNAGDGVGNGIFDPNDVGVVSGFYGSFPAVTTLNADTLFFFPFLPYESATFDGVSINNTTTGGTGGFYGIYDINPENGLPLNRLAQTQLIDTTVASIKTTNFLLNQTFELESRWYWGGYACDAGLQYRAYVFTGGTPVGLETLGGLLTPATGVFVALTPGFTELPNPAPTSGYSLTTAPSLIAGWHKAP